jgi:hypothetical protein
MRLATCALILLATTASLFAQEAASPSPSMHGGHAAHHGASSGGPTQTGQSAFAAIEEIVALLEQDPKTDWSKVNIEALRQHLIDMDNVTLGASAVAEPTDGGIRYRVTGTGAVAGSIQRMLTAHARMMDGANGFALRAELVPDGALLSVTTSQPQLLPKLRALGFIGLMTSGMHHQMHHWKIASGENPHH